MKKIKLLGCLLTALLPFAPAKSQRICGTQLSGEMVKSFQEMPKLTIPMDPVTNRPTSVTTLKIQFHVVCSGNLSTATVNNTQITDALTYLNTKFAPSGLSFEQCSDVDYILNNPDDADYFEQDEIHRVRINPHDRTKAINVYFHHHLSLGEQSGFATQPGLPSYTYINSFSHSRIHVASEYRIGSSSSPWIATNLELTLVHEMGHYFGLHHTSGPAIGRIPELVDRSLITGNSAYAGDEVFDTPADPGLIQYFGGGTTCTYPNVPLGCPTFCDANGDLYQPLADNIMWEDARWPCLTNFTLGQYQRIYSTYNAYYQGQYEGGQDLVIKDDKFDAGYEPNVTSTSQYGLGIWASPDLWNCRTSGTCTEHENPGFLSPNKNTLRVNVTNKGCATSQPGILHTYWTLGSTGETWSQAWINATLCGNPAGNEIPDMNTGMLGKVLPTIAAGASTIMDFDWRPINHTNYSWSCLSNGLVGDANKNPMICVLARIESFNDQMYSESTGPIKYNVINNNNIATRNASLVSMSAHLRGVPDYGNGGSVLLQNALSESAEFNVHFRDISSAPGTYHASTGKVLIQLSDDLWNAWEGTGMHGSGISIDNIDFHRISIDQSDAVLYKIPMRPSEVFQAGFTFYQGTTTSHFSNNEFILYQTLVSQDEELVGSGCVFKVNVLDGGPEVEDDMNDELTGRTEDEARGVAANGASSVGTVIADATVYPNPATGNAYLRFGVKDAASFDITLTDIQGKTMQKIAEKKAYAPGTHEETIDISRIASGMYLIRIESANKAETLRLTISNTH